MGKLDFITAEFRFKLAFRPDKRGTCLWCGEWKPPILRVAVGLSIVEKGYTQSICEQCLYRMHEMPDPNDNALVTMDEAAIILAPVFERSVWTVYHLIADELRVGGWFDQVVKYMPATTTRHVKHIPLSSAYDFLEFNHVQA